MEMFCKGKPSIKKFSCSLCDYTADYKQNLKKHIQSVHDENKSYKCSVCEFASSYKHVTHRHILTVHGNKNPHKCLFCDHNSANSRDLKIHVDSVHNENKQVVVEPKNENHLRRKKKFSLFASYAKKIDSLVCTSN